MQIEKDDKIFMKKFIPLATLIAGMCCFAPVILVLFGLSTISFAASLADTLYGDYKWVFRGMGLLFLFGSLAWYLYTKEKVCSLDAFKRKRRKIINIILLSTSIAIIVYILWLYVIVEIIGIWLGIW